MSALPSDNKIPPYILVALAVLGGGGAGFSLQPESADSDRLTRVEERLDHLIRKVETGILPEADRRITAIEWQLTNIQRTISAGGMEF